MQDLGALFAIFRHPEAFVQTIRQRWVSSAPSNLLFAHHLVQSNRNKGKISTESDPDQGKFQGFPLRLSVARMSSKRMLVCAATACRGSGLTAWP